MNESAHLALARDFTLGPVDRRLFGSFLEHLGRAVYGGIYDPEHPTADEDGLRTDVLELAREMGVSVIRYPGGNFVSGYRWEDGVGPVADRPSRLELAWRSVEPNTFGLHEFVRFTRRLGADPMLAINLGTRGIAEAVDLVEYTNHPGGTRLSDQRRANGATEPLGVRLWCLGNEMDGPWQLGRKTAREYGHLAAETAKAIRLVDPSVELVACGSSGRGMATFGRWEADVLDEAYAYVDYLSLHAYFSSTDGDLPSFLASAVDMDAFISEVIATCDHVRAVKREKKKLRLSFDEWNVWYMPADGDPTPKHEPWHVAPTLYEDTYSAADAVAVGSYLITLLNHADRVAIACQAQLVNVIAPIRAEASGPAWRQTTFFPFALTAAHAQGSALRVALRSPEHDTAKYGSVPSITAAATYDENTGAASVFVVNRSLDQALPLTIDVRGLAVARVVDHVVLTDDELTAVNSVDQPDRIRPVPSEDHTIDAGQVALRLPPVSWTMLRLQ